MSILPYITTLVGCTFIPLAMRANTAPTDVYLIHPQRPICNETLLQGWIRKNPTVMDIVYKTIIPKERELSDTHLVLYHGQSSQNSVLTAIIDRIEQAQRRKKDAHPIVYFRSKHDLAQYTKDVATVRANIAKELQKNSCMHPIATIIEQIRVGCAVEKYRIQTCISELPSLHSCFTKPYQAVIKGVQCMGITALSMLIPLAPLRMACLNRFTDFAKLPTGLQDMVCNTFPQDSWFLRCPGDMREPFRTMLLSTNIALFGNTHNNQDSSSLDYVLYNRNQTTLLYKDIKNILKANNIGIKSHDNAEKCYKQMVSIAKTTHVGALYQICIPKDTIDTCTYPSFILGKPITYQDIQQNKTYNKTKHAPMSWVLNRYCRHTQEIDWGTFNSIQPRILLPKLYEIHNVRIYTYDFKTATQQKAFAQTLDTFMEELQLPRKAKNIPGLEASRKSKRYNKCSFTSLVSP